MSKSLDGWDLFGMYGTLGREEQTGMSQYIRKGFIQLVLKRLLEVRQSSRVGPQLFDKTKCCTLNKWKLMILHSTRSFLQDGDWPLPKLNVAVMHYLTAWMPFPGSRTFTTRTCLTPESDPFLDSDVLSFLLSSCESSTKNSSSFFLIFGVGVCLHSPQPFKKTFWLICNCWLKMHFAWVFNSFGKTVKIWIYRRNFLFVIYH